MSFIEPTKYPERLAPLFYACSMADCVLVVVDEVNAQFGECVLMLDAAGLKEGYFVLHNFIPQEKVAPLIKGTALEGYGFLEEDMVALREFFLEKAENKPSPSSGAVCGSVPIDHHFAVKGVGTVVLGYVAQGTIHRHDTLHALPGKKDALIRSIQKHDDDFDVATTGDRVGLALKGIDSEELDRGFVLTNDPAIKSDARILSKAKLVKYWPTPLKEGMVLHVGHWMQFMPARVATVDSSSDFRAPTIELVMEKEIVHPPLARAVLTYLDGGKLRIAGTVELP